MDEFKASAEFKNNKIKNLVLDSVFPNKKELKLTINTAENGEKVTTVFTNFPKPIVSRYKFIKGFEKGTLDFQSIKKNGVSKSVLKIFNFIHAFFSPVAYLYNINFWRMLPGVVKL